MTRTMNGHRKVDWTGVIGLLLTALIACFGAVFFMGNRLETPEQKRSRIDRALSPIWVELQRMEAHRQKGGHAVMDARVTSIERRLQSLDEVEREETEILRDLTDSITQFIDHEMRRDLTPDPRR